MGKVSGFVAATGFSSITVYIQNIMLSCFRAIESSSNISALNNAGLREVPRGSRVLSFDMIQDGYRGLTMSGSALH